MSGQPGRARPTKSRERPGSPRGRLFLALEPPADAREAIAAWRDGAIEGRDDLRPVGRDALHVTLVFLGYQPLRAVPEIAESAFDSLRACAPALLAPTGLKAVPPRRPRLFALDLEDDGSGATAIHGAASAALEAGGFYRPERRPFWPHITLARVKRDRRAEPLEAAASLPEPFIACDVTLYRSHLGPAGARYEALERVSLGID